MTLSFAKHAALWSVAGILWIAATALLGALGLSAPWLAVLHLAVLGAGLGWIGRRGAARGAVAFLAPPADGPIPLAPYAGTAAWISGFGTVGLVAALLMDGAAAYGLVGAVVGALTLSLMLVAPALSRARSRSLRGWFVERFGAGAGPVAAGALIAGALAMLTVQLGFAALVAEAVPGLPAGLAVSVTALLAMLAVLGGGMGTLARAQALLFVALAVGILVPAAWLGIARTGIAVPHVAPGALLHETQAAMARLGEGAADDPVAAAMLSLTVLLGLLAQPHTLVRWPAGARDGGSRVFARRSVVMAVAVMGAIPLLAIAARAWAYGAAVAQGGAMPAFDAPGTALAEAIALAEPPAWLLAASGAGALAAIVAACAGAALVVVDALSGDPARETAGGTVLRYRWTAALAVVLAAGTVLTVPFDPLAAFLALLAFSASAFVVPLLAGALWPGATAAGALAGAVVGGVAFAVSVLAGWHPTSGLAPLCVPLSAAATAIVSTVRPGPAPPTPAER